ncbi:hypothetical protein BCR33DRAFT_715912, partial [Rhizoclosmatium globosum]
EICLIQQLSFCQFIILCEFVRWKYKAAFGLIYMSSNVLQPILQGSLGTAVIHSCRN